MDTLILLRYIIKKSDELEFLMRTGLDRSDIQEVLLMNIHTKSLGENQFSHILTNTGYYRYFKYFPN